MKDVARVHRLQAESNLVQAKLAEVFREDTLPLQDNFGKVTTFHEFNEDPEAILEVVNFFTREQLVTIEV